MGNKKCCNNSEPPMGVKPLFVNASERITDLSNAIGRYAVALDDPHRVMLVAEWAKEIQMQCETLLQLHTYGNELAQQIK